MQKVSLEAIAHEQLAVARQAASARSATTVYGGSEHALRQTVIALCGDAVLDEHENPGEATLYVISGQVELAAGDERWQGQQGDLLTIPDARHSLRAAEDAVVLLTAVPRGHIG
jgi:quercetin dioxygenase-like cupin family protein